MKRKLPILALVALAGAGVAAAEEGDKAPATMSSDWSNSEINFGASSVDVNTPSSKFEEYRDVPNGVWFRSLLFEGKKGDLRYDFFGENFRQADQRYTGKVGNDIFRLEGTYDKIPHRFGNAGRTIETNTAPGVWQISDTLQQSFQTQLENASTINYGFLSTMLAPSIATANLVDDTLSRERAKIGLRFFPTGPVSARVLYTRERRTGTRAASGTSFGFGNVIELPETMAYLTQDVGGTVSANGTWGSARAGAHYNWFRNNVPVFDWDNPFRATDGTDSRAYIAPGASINGPTFGRMALPPDNEAVTGSAGVTLKLPSHTRMMADVSRGKWTQNSTPFIGYTTNTAIELPGPLPATHLDGKANVTSLSLMLVSRPVRNVSVTARFRRYDFDNQTPRLTFPGYVRFDGVWEEVPRISVPYGYTNDRFQATVGYDFGLIDLEAGYKNIGMDRTYRETESTSDGGVFFAANLRKEWVVVRASYEHMNRDFSGLEIERSEDASFVDPGSPANLLAEPAAEVCGSSVVCNLRFDQAKRKVDKIGGQVQLSPGDKVAFGLSYFKNKADYPDTQFGLQTSSYDTFSIEVDYTANERVSLNGFYSRETMDEMQVGRQSGATVSLNPLDNWSSAVDNKVNSIGAGANFVLVPDKWKLQLDGSYQKVDGNNAIAAPAGGAPDNARPNGVQSIAGYDDTKLAMFQGQLQYTFAPSWTAAVGGRFEDYKIVDPFAADAYYEPAALFLNAIDGNYRATVAFVSMTYHW